MQVEQFLKRSGLKKSAGLERRGRTMLSFLAIAIIITELVLLLLAFSYNSLVNSYDRLVSEDMLSAKDLDRLQMREQSITQYVQLQYINDQRIENRVMVDRFINGWDSLFKRVQVTLRDYIDQDLLHQLDESHDDVRAYYESIIDSLNTNRVDEARKMLLSREFQTSRQQYISRLSQIRTELTEVHASKISDERKFFTWFVVLLAFVIPLVLSIWLVASRAIASAESRSIKESMDRAIEPKTIKKTTTIHEGYAKNQLLANISHEIRTPMNSIMGMVALLLDSNIENEEREYAKAINSSAHVLLNLIDDVLVLSKMEAGKLELETRNFDLRLVMEDTMEILGVLAEDQGLECTCLVNMNVPYQLRGDPLRLRQIVINLVGEVMKYSERGEISVRVALKEESDESVTINTVVVNTDHNEAGNVSNMVAAIRETKSADNVRSLEKYGLAYGVTKQLLELMDGTIDAHVENGKPLFYFDAKFEKQYEDTLSEQDVCRELEGKRVLVAESNSFVRANICELLRNWGCLAFEALDSIGARNALNMAEEDGHPYDIILVDMNIEGGGGNALVKKIKDKPAISHTICIMMIPQGEHMQKQEIGLAAMVSKPIMQSRLYETMAKSVRRSVGEDRKRTNFIADAKLKTNLQEEYRILLVEDNPVNQKLTMRLLERCGYHAESADNGDIAVKKLEDGFYDLILMDCQMPVMDGYEATRLIRENEKKKDRIPIIAMTANAMKGDKERCLEAGMDDYIAKPIKIEELIDILQQWLRPEEEGMGASALEPGP